MKRTVITSGVVYSEKINGLLTYVVIKHYKNENFFKTSYNFDFEIYQYGKILDNDLRDYEYGKAKMWCEQHLYDKELKYI